MASTLGELNPLRYRGYVYDTETKLYYLQSRYYNPQMCRFINADSQSVLTASPRSVTDKNLFAYCDNNPVVRKDNGGYFWDTIFDIISLIASIGEVIASPGSPAAWVGLSADLVCTVVPGLTDGGTVVRAVTKADDVIDIAKTVHKAPVNINTLRRSAVKKAWTIEYDNVLNGGPGVSRFWSESEIKQIERNGKVKGYVGHHMKSVRGYPQFAGDPNNIQFLTYSQHFDAHGRNWRNITHERYEVR